MKVLHSGSLDVTSGGPAKSTYLTIKGLLHHQVGASMLMFPLVEGGKLIGDDVDIIYTKPLRNIRFAYMPKLEETLNSIHDVDLYHVQGLWQYLGHKVASYARAKSRPYVITLRGMLYPAGLNHSSWIKKTAMALYQREDLQKAACIQATCTEEMEIYRRLGFKNPVAVLPNPIEITGVVDRPIPSKGRLRIGYLGRVHPRKRIERLIYAFANHREAFDDCELIIIGAGDKKYEHYLRQEVERLHLNNVLFTGFLTGEEKDRAIMNLSFLAVPSDFENFGNIVTEALVRGVPVIASKGMPWQDLEKYNCGWWISNDQHSIDKALLNAIKLSDEERIAMGFQGKKLMKEKYSVEVLGQKMKALYDWIITKENKPDFVYE